MAGIWGVSPRQSVEAEAARIGADAVVSRCLALLRGDDVEDAFVLAAGGPAARDVLAGREGGRSGCWPRVWATRALLYAWDDRAAAALVAATTDESWRVREMAAKVIARHRVDEALDALSDLAADPVPRVRQAAERARRQLTTADTA